MLHISIGGSYSLKHPGDGISERKTGFTAQVTIVEIHPDALYPIKVKIDAVTQANPTATPTLNSTRWVEEEWLSAL